MLRFFTCKGKESNTSGKESNTDISATGSDEQKGSMTRERYFTRDHLDSAEEVAARLGSHVDFDDIGSSPGLSSIEAQAKQREHGLNELTPPKTTPEIIKFLSHFLNPLMVCLLMAGGLTFLAYAIQQPRDMNNAIMAAALICIVLFTCMMTYLQEREASNVMSSLKKMLPWKCSVYRGGSEVSIPVNQVVPGDLVRLRIGDRVPADLRIILSNGLKAECSSLTGESEAVSLFVDRRDESPEHSQCIAFASTLIMQGQGYGVVIKTGDLTFIGSIARLAGSTGVVRSTLQVEVGRLVLFIGLLAFWSGIILFCIGVGRGFPVLVAFVNGFILVIVANVPEGLPATVTSLLSLTALRLREKKVLIKRTDIVENLGCASVIASDKTGTITENNMRVSKVMANNEMHEAQVLNAHLLEGRGGMGLGGIGSKFGRGSRIPGKLGTLSRSINPASLRIIERKSRSLAHQSAQPAPLAPEASSAGGDEEQGGVGPQLEERDVLTPLPETSRVGRGQNERSLAQSSLPPRSYNHESISARMSLGRRSMGTGEDYRMEIQPARGDRDRAHGTLGSSSASNAVEFSLPMITGPESIDWEQSGAIARLVYTATVCNAAEFVSSSSSTSSMAKPARSRQLKGDATDQALIRWVEELNVPSAATRIEFTVLHSIPFNSVNKYAATICQIPNGSRPSDPHDNHLLLLKGAPEVVLAKCSRYYHNGSDNHPVTPEFTASIMKNYERCGFNGERVIGFGYSSLPPINPTSLYAQEEPPTDNLVFLGLISLIDPPRKGVREAVELAKRAGVRVLMVTGDHPLTAEAIARQVGIITLKTAREVAADSNLDEADVGMSHPDVGAVIVTGAKMRELEDDAAWDEVLDHEEIVFARTSPHDKLLLVEHLQRRKEVVAVTGDGVNDAAALKRAHVGVAMGVMGSDVCREAGDLILLDDNFGSIVDAIKEGRLIYDNLKKTIFYTLTHAVPELWPIFLNLALGFPLALPGLLILVIDLVTEQGPAISLAYEPAEDLIMSRDPRDIETDRLISGPGLRYSYLIAGTLVAAVSTLGFFTIFWFSGVRVSDLLFSQDASRTNFFVTPPSAARPYISEIACQIHPYSSGPPPDPNLSITCLPMGGGAGRLVFDGEKQLDIYHEALTCYFVTLILCQFWHIWLCKTRVASIFTHGIFRNTVTIFGVFISLIVMVVVVFIPALQPIFLTANLGGIGWLPHLVFLLIMLPYTEMTKWAARNHPESWWATRMAW